MAQKTVETLRCIYVRASVELDLLDGLVPDAPSSGNEDAHTPNSICILGPHIIINKMATLMYIFNLHAVARMFELRRKPTTSITPSSTVPAPRKRPSHAGFG